MYRDATDIRCALFHDRDEDAVSRIKQEQGNYQLSGMGTPELEDPVRGTVHSCVLTEVNHEYQQKEKSTDDIGLFHREIFCIEFGRS